VEKCIVGLKSVRDHRDALHFTNHSTKAPNENRFSIDIYFSRQQSLGFYADLHAKEIICKRNYLQERNLPEDINIAARI